MCLFCVEKRRSECDNCFLMARHFDLKKKEKRDRLSLYCELHIAKPFLGGLPGSGVYIDEVHTSALVLWKMIHLIVQWGSCNELKSMLNQVFNHVVILEIATYRNGAT